jgi:uncharacterized protein (TIGR00266 family)
MKIEIQNRPAYAIADVHLELGESVISEGGAMVSMTTDITVTTSTMSTGSGAGGLLKGLKRMLTGESFFLNKFTSSTGGHVSFAPTLIGDVEHITLDGTANLVVQSSSFMACSEGLSMDTQFGGMKSLFAGESLFWIQFSGSGELLLNSFGGIFCKEIDGSFIVDTGHIVAFEDSLEYKIKKVGGLKATLLSGEGLVTEFYGKGRLFMQTHNASAFGGLLGPKLPPRQR